MNTQFIHFTQREVISLSAVKDSRWEPDGVTLQVRFCEGGATYRITGDSRRYSPLLPVVKGRTNVAGLQNCIADHAIGLVAAERK